MNVYKKLISVTGLSLLLGGTTLFAVEVTGVLGSPSATTTVKGDQLPPPPDTRFGG